MREALLTIAEVAARLRCNPHTVRRWIWDQRLEAVKVGDLVRVPETALASFLQPVREAKKTSKRAAGSQRGASALLTTVQKLRQKVKRTDVEELERLIRDAVLPPDWSKPLA